MLNPILRNQLAPEVRLIYDSKIKPKEAIIENLLIDRVRSIRKKNKKMAVDPLENKLIKFGNNGGWYRARAPELIREFFIDNKHISNDFIGHWRSIEFELIFNSPQDCSDFCHILRSLKLNKFVTIKTDISIKTNEQLYATDNGTFVKLNTGVPREVVFSYRSGNEDAVRNFCKALKGRAYVNRSCGTHFHLDVRHLEAEEATVYARRLARCVPALRLLLPKTRRESKYCKELINTIEKPATNEGRYAFVNLSAYSKHKTIEVRGHSGTINADKILNWIKLCEYIMAVDLNFMPNAEYKNNVESIEQLISQYRFDEILSGYVKDRHQTFNSSTKNDTENEESIVSIEISTPKGLILQPKKLKEPPIAPV